LSRNRTKADAFRSNLPQLWDAPAGLSSQRIEIFSRVPTTSRGTEKMRPQGKDRAATGPDGGRWRGG
jgi:hypothetical protein